MPTKDKHPKTDIMNADEVAEWLRIPKSTLYKVCNEGQIPAAKIGRHWRFDRQALKRWFEERAGRYDEEYVTRDAED